MKIVRLTGLAALATLAFQPVAQAATVLQTANYNGHSYAFIADDSQSRLLWTEAEAFAVLLGGHLVTVDDAAENDFLLQTFGPTALTLAPPGGGLVSLWLGLNDAANEGQFVWSNQSPVAYTNFVPGEPAGGIADEDYIGMLVGTQFGQPGQWHDIVSDFRFNDVTFGVVEVAPVPLPPALWLLGSSIAGLSGIARRRQST